MIITSDWRRMACIDVRRRMSDIGLMAWCHDAIAIGVVGVVPPNPPPPFVDAAFHAFQTVQNPVVKNKTAQNGHPTHNTATNPHRTAHTSFPIN
mmetsp:Transcript_1503/g.3407  ORF Transcript_1503/g.3407 Transcript_1503/m.3407 type:complete len:94 (-) Transcript_1503:7-288(-)